MKSFVSSVRKPIKKSVSCALTLGLIASLFAFSPLSAQTNRRRNNRLKEVKAARLEKGVNVGERVKQLRATNNVVNAALEAFEKKGHKPKFDEAFSFSGTFEQPREVALRLTTRLNKPFPATELRSFLSAPSSCSMNGRGLPLQTSTMPTEFSRSNT
jgi:hypothetical protein